MEILVTLAVAILVTAIIVSRSRNKLTTCPKCKGKTRLDSMFFPGRYRICDRCGGRGEITLGGG